MKIAPKHIVYLLRGLLAFGAVAFFAIMFIGLSMLTSKSHSLADARLQSKIVEDQQASLTQAKAEINKYSYFKEVAKSVIPTDKDQAQAVVDIFKIADQSGISLQNLTFPASTLGVGGSGASSGTSSSVPASKSILSQAKPVTGISGLYGIEVIIAPENDKGTPANKLPTYDKMLDFLRRIERNRRTAQITNIKVEPTQGSPYVNFSLNLNIFIKP